MIFLFFFLFALKHFMADFALQTPFQYRNKGTYGHLGGILHAYIHTVGTFLVLALCQLPLPLGWLTIFSLLDGVVHYHIDYAVVNIKNFFNWNDFNAKPFWIVLGFDQFLHYSTYILIINFLVV